MDCLVIGTNLKVRLPNLITTLKSIDSCTKELVNKMVSIDAFQQHETQYEISDCKELQDYCQQNRWELLIHSKLGMCDNIMYAVDKITSEYLLYCEDDIILTGIPSITEIKKYSKVEDRELGFINMTIGDWRQYDTTKLAKKINEKANVFSLNNAILVHQPEQDYRGSWFIAFPVAVFNSCIFKEVIKSTKKNQVGIQIEQAMTNEWFRLEYDKKYFKCVYFKDIYQQYSLFTESNVFRILETNSHVQDNRAQPPGVLLNYCFHS